MSEGAISESGPTMQILAAAAVAAMLCGVGIWHVAGKVAAVEEGYQLGQLEDAHRQLERENVALKLQVATLKSAAHIETTARTTLGMTAPNPQMVWHVGGPIAPVVKQPAKVAKKPHASKGGIVGPAGSPMALLAPR